MKDKLIEERLKKLEKSTFRTSFKLKEKDVNYIEKNGLNKVIEHGYGFVEKRLKPSRIDNDGKQTPTKGHPFFISQHATATCCRKCLEKWHNICQNKELSQNEINFIISINITWIRKQIKKVNF